MIIGFAGKAGSGKDTAGNYLKLKQWQHYQFARPLKMIVAKMLDLPLNAMENRDLKDHKLQNKIVLTEDDAHLFMSLCPEPILGHEQANKIIDTFEGKELSSIRELLQFIGTDVGRNLINQNIWINSAKKSLENLSKSVNVVLTDVRFENERDAISELGGFTIRINRNSESIGDHASELGKFTVDTEIDNNGSMQSMYDQIEEFLNDTKRKRSIAEKAN